MAKLSVTVNEKTKLVTIQLPMQDPTPSKSGKTLVIASTHGNHTTETLFQGRPLVVGANVYIRQSTT